MNPDPRAFKRNARAALQDAKLQEALGRIRTGFQQKRAEARAALPEFETLRDEAAALKDHVLANLAHYLEIFEARFTANGGKVHWARDAAEARDVILALLKKAGARSVAKGKSMVSEEIALNPYLAANGIVPVETDLGEYIVQLRDEPPSHILAPAFHLSRGEVAQSFRAAHALPPARDLESRRALVDEARAVLREKFLAADAGITGANILVAETGSAVLVTNEGNGDLSQTCPRLLIALATIEKVVPTLDDAGLILRLLARSATGQEMSSYTSLRSGPKREDDPDGPEEFHIVLLDNGRANLIGSEAQDVLRCIRCGACLNHCPVYAAAGGHAYGAVYPGPIGAALNPALLGVREAYHHPNASTFCGRCAEVCPVKIPLPKIMRHWREAAYESGAGPVAPKIALRLWAFFASRPRAYRAASRILVRLLKLLAGKQARLRALPFGGGWTKFRDFPAPQGHTFNDLCREAVRDRSQ